MSAVLEAPPLAVEAFDAYDQRRWPSPHPYANDPVGYCRDVLRFEPWSKQREILESVRDHTRTAVRSAHGVGKTAIAARVVLWWLRVFPESKVITTSATWKQVKSQLWANIEAAYNASGKDVGGKLTEAQLKIDAEHFALGLSVDVPENFAGFHSPELLIVLDEASGVSEPVWETAETYLTSPGSHLLAIGNPTHAAGAFYRAFTKERELYNTIAISAFDSPAVSGEDFPPNLLGKLTDRTWIEGRKKAWGEESPAYQVRVLGQFSTSTDDTVCSLADVEAAREREATEAQMVQPVVIGCDVARFGSDSTVIAVRHGRRVRIVRDYVGKDTMQTVGHILDVARQVAAGTCPEAPHKTEPPSLIRIVVDDVGVGGGVTDRLREVGEFQVVPFNGGNSAWTDDYPNRRSELWFSFAERLPTLDIDDDDDLADDLVAPRYKLDSAGRRVVEPKAITKETLGRSPDRADGVMLTFAVPDRVPLPAVAQRPENRPITAGLMERQW